MTMTKAQKTALTERAKALLTCVLNMSERRYVERFLAALEKSTAEAVDVALLEQIERAKKLEW